VTDRPKIDFGAHTLSHLRAAAAGEAKGSPLEISLDDIDEDPSQPRRVFDATELKELAATIREHGVIQPITVNPPEAGRYRLRFGARRLQASRLAGKATIPAQIQSGHPKVFEQQIIENQHRQNLSNSDLAAAIHELVASGKTSSDIQTICRLKDYQVTAFKAVAHMPDELRARLDNSDIRALYDLSRQWLKTPEAVIEALPDLDSFLSITEARRIIAGITGKPSGNFTDAKAAVVLAAVSISSEQAGDGHRQPDQAEPRIEYNIEEPDGEREDGDPLEVEAFRESARASGEGKKPAKKKTTFVVVDEQNRQGRLIMTEGIDDLVGQTLHLRVTGLA
jgi:ParB family chromosome partitioning protein